MGPRPAPQYELRQVLSTLLEQVPRLAQQVHILAQQVPILAQQVPRLAQDSLLIVQPIRLGQHRRWILFKVTAHFITLPIDDLLLISLLQSEVLTLNPQLELQRHSNLATVIIPLTTSYYITIFLIIFI